MKTHRSLASLGVLVSTLFLSACMAAMMPAMMFGHAAHKNEGAAHDQIVKPCECEKPVTAKTDEPSSAAHVGEPPSPSPNNGHKH